MIVTILCGYSFGYPIGFDETKFDSLKMALLKLQKQSTTIEQARQTPFYVIVMTRTGKQKLGDSIVKKTYKIFARLIHGHLIHAGDTGKSGKIISQKLNTDKSTLKTDLKKALD